MSGRWRRLTRPWPLGFSLALLVFTAVAAWSHHETAQETDDSVAIAQWQTLAALSEDNDAFRHLLKLAESGSSLAQRAAGTLLLASRQPERQVAGQEWLKKAADQGDAEAAFMLGRARFLGQGQPLDYGEAKHWFERAEAHGSAVAAYYLGVMQRGGYGEVADTGKAIPWFAKAASRDVPEALFVMGNLLRAGEGVPRDWPQALTHYRRAGELEHPAALQTLAMIYQNGEMDVPADPNQARHFFAEAAHALKHYQAP